MGTLATITTRVQTRIIDTPTAIQDEVTGLINAAMHKLQTKHNFKVMETLLAASTTVDTRVLTTLPSDFKEWRGKPYYVRDEGDRQRMVWAAARGDLTSYIDEDDDSFPMVLLVSEPTDTGAANIEVWPLPDGNSDYDDGEYRIKMPYYRYLPALAADGDTNWFTVNAEDWLVNQAVAEGFFLDWDEERATVWAQRAQLELSEVIGRDKKYRLSTVETLVPHQGPFEWPME